MSERITRANLEDRAANLSHRLPDGLKVIVQGRNGGFGVDLYRKGREMSPGIYGFDMLRTLTFGTKRECADFLHAAMIGIDLSHDQS